MHFGLRPDEIARIRQACAALPEIAEVIVFGSRAIGTSKPGSDVDLALKGHLDERTVARLSAALNEELPLPYFFDVVDYHAITNTALREHIDQHGQRIFPADAP
ncbi:MAG: nucleotidyltransferase domain-containing protein [Deltaproteobacteria bacterium]|nr:nucleotidyltransferase domain-containing protein [Deltaproteobacteria bacterium]